jgi:hypothetical protein
MNQLTEEFNKFKQARAEQNHLPFVKVIMEGAALTDCPYPALVEAGLIGHYKSAVYDYFYLKDDIRTYPRNIMFQFPDNFNLFVNVKGNKITSSNEKLTAFAEKFIDFIRTHILKLSSITMTSEQKTALAYYLEHYSENPGLISGPNFIIEDIGIELIHLSDFLGKEIGNGFFVDWEFMDGPAREVKCPQCEHKYIDRKTTEIITCLECQITFEI